MASEGNDHLPPPPSDHPPLERSLTIYGRYTKKSCKQCENQVHINNIGGCILYPRGPMFCSQECEDIWKANHRGRNSGE